jgi:hypothetical protein
LQDRPEDRFTPVSPTELEGSGRSALTRTDRPNNDLQAVDEDLRAVLMLQRRVHRSSDLQEREGVIAVREPGGPPFVSRALEDRSTSRGILQLLLAAFVA